MDKFRKKLKLLVVIGLIVCLALVIINNENISHLLKGDVNPDSNTFFGFENEYRSIANYTVYDDVNELEDHVDLVVSATFTGNSKNVIKALDPEMYPFASSEFGETHNEIEVLEVLKEDRRRDVTEKEKLVIVEPTYIIENGADTGIRVSYGEYTELAKDSSYILFLSWSEDLAKYEIDGLHQGKYNIDGRDKKEPEALAYNENYKELADQVRNKYKLTKLGK